MTLGALVLGGIVGCGGGAPSAPAIPAGPPPFSEVDPYTSPYFITLEGTGLVESQGAERLYNLGVNTCSRLDSGRSVADEIAFVSDSNLGDEAGSVVGAAVAHLCPQHEPAVREYLDNR